MTRSAGLLGVLFFAAREEPLKIKFQVEHFNVETRKSAPLKPDEAASFAAGLRELAAVQDAACTENTATVTLKPGATLRLSELRSAGKKALSYDGGKPVIVFNTVKAEGKVTLTLHVEKNRDKVKEALREAGFKDVTESGENYDGTARMPVDVVTVVKKVAAKTGVEYRLFDILKDVAWHAPAKAAPE
jgi:hypothetical protein